MPDQGLPYFYFREGADGQMDKATFEKRNARAFLFLDRSIYRPGQTVYFKGITITRDFETRQSKIWTGRQAKLFLYNANGEKLDSLDLTTNEFGSYHGTFRLPEHQLNGLFRIADESAGGNQSFSVEEYKSAGILSRIGQAKRQLPGRRQHSGSW